MAKKSIGTMPCQCCGKEVVIKKTELGAMSYRCQWCEDAPYQKPGTGAYASWERKIDLFAEAKSAEPDEARPAPQPAQPAKQAASCGTFFG